MITPKVSSEMLMTMYLNTNLPFVCRSTICRRTTKSLETMLKELYFLK